MFGHLPELFIIVVLALIVFGPERLPEVAANAGKLVREVREAVNVTMNPEDHQVPDDFTTYYYESLERSGEDVPVAEMDDPGHETDDFSEVELVDDMESMDGPGLSIDNPSMAHGMRADVDDAPHDGEGTA